MHTDAVIGRVNRNFTLLTNVCVTLGRRPTLPENFLHHRSPQVQLVQYEQYVQWVQCPVWNPESFANCEVFVRSDRFQ